MFSEKVYIIILNWNGWRDTIECLESIFRLQYDNYQVIVCDNNSSDGSLEYIKAWADGKLDVFVPRINKLWHLTYPPVDKSIQYKEYGRKEAESHGTSDVRCPLILINTGDNLGFAGGNNVGLRHTLVRDDFDYIWLINNDTVVEPDSLKILVSKENTYKISGINIGLIGAKLMYYDQPHIIQGIGGIYNKWFATSKHLGAFECDNMQFDNEEVLKKINYPIGASLLASKKFILDVGLMCEDYFLYYEEHDWVLRGKRKGWMFGYCWKTKVYHKEGMSIGSSNKGDCKSDISDYYDLKNRILFTEKFFFKYIYVVKISFIIVFFNRIRRKQFKRLPSIIGLICKK